MPAAPPAPPSASFRQRRNAQDLAFALLRLLSEGIPMSRRLLVGISPFVLLAIASCGSSSGGNSNPDGGGTNPGEDGGGTSSGDDATSGSSSGGTSSGGSSAGTGSSGGSGSGGLDASSS